MQIDLLMRMAPMVVRLNITNDRNQWYGIQRRIGQTGNRVSQPRPDVEKNHSGLSRRSGVSIRGVSRDLFMTSSDESDSTTAERIEHLNDGVTAQSENDFDAK